MPYDRLKKSIEVFGQEVLFQGYGLTEATANICILRPEDHILDGSEAQQKRLLSCGREHSNHQLRVFDDNNKEVKQGEVGEILFSHPSVLEAAVAGVSHRDFGEVPRAFVALREGATATEEEIIQFCKEHLASYKCPKSVTFLDELPKTASGKITRAGIQEKYVTRKERS